METPTITHTPPWYYHDWTKAVWSGGQIIANVRERHRDKGPLIAAAPELLTACEAALADWHSHPKNILRKEPPYLALLRVAIAKAREK